MLIPLRDDQGGRGVTPVTWGLCVVWIVGFAAQLLVEPSTAERWHDALVLRRETWWGEWRAIQAAGLDADMVRTGRAVLPVLGHPLIHAGVLHAVSNIVGLLIFGGRLEQRAGSVRFVILVLFSVLIGAALDLGVGASGLGAWARSSGLVGAGGPAVLGGSTIVAACLAAYLVRHWRARVTVVVPVLLVVPVFAEVRAWVMLVVWLVLQARPLSRLLEVGGAEPLSWSALLGAAIVGLGVSPWLCSRRGRHRAA